MTLRRWPGALGAAALTAVPWCACVTAQQPNAGANELQRLSRELLETSARGARLVELRVRHELGLEVKADTHWQLAEEERAPAPEHWQKQLETGQADLQRLSAQEDALRRVLDQRRLRAEDLVLTPLPLVEARPRVVPSVSEPRPHVGAEQREPPAPAPAPASRPATPRDEAPASEGAALILGSTDHATVGRALFQARRFEEARKELLLIPAEGARLVDLFLLARCHEQLGAAEEARQVYLAIEARDTRPDDAVGGPWAQAARSARRTMGWLQDRGAWKPAVTLEPRSAPARKQ